MELSSSSPSSPSGPSAPIDVLGSKAETKLSIDPQISEQSNQRRVAIFKLSDGTLTITCDGTNGVVTVSTQSN